MESRRYDHPLQGEVDRLQAALTEVGRINQIVKTERDKAEDRFIAAREEASELEQEMADLRGEVGIAKTMRDQALVKVDDHHGDLMLTAVLAVIAGLILGHYVL